MYKLNPWGCQCSSNPRVNRHETCVPNVPSNARSAKQRTGRVSGCPLGPVDVRFFFLQIMKKWRESQHIYYIPLKDGIHSYWDDPYVEKKMVGSPRRRLRAMWFLVNIMMSHVVFLNYLSDWLESFPVFDWRVLSELGDVDTVWWTACDGENTMYETCTISTGPRRIERPTWLIS